MEMRGPPKGATLLRVIKTPVWKETQKSAEESGCPLKVGDKTWGTDSWYDGQSVVFLEGNRWGINFDKSCFEVINVEEIKELSDEELLEIAKEKYPVGTVYNPLKDDGRIYRGLEGSKVSKTEPQMLGSCIEAGPGYIYAKATKQWAEIVSSVKFEKGQLYSDEELLKIAAAKYPVGTKYKGLFSDGRVEPGYSVSAKQPEFHQEGKLIDVGSIFCYFRETNTWAEVVKDEEPVELPENELLMSKSETQPAPSQPEPQRTSEKEVKPRYRIKTREEFKRDGRMLGAHPRGWSRTGEMDSFYGQALPKSYYLEGITTFILEGWSFSAEHDIVEVTEYPLTSSEALGKTSTLGDISYQIDIEIEKVKKENVKRDFTPMKNIV